MGGLLKQYIWVVNLVVILFCTYFAAKIINVYVGKALEVHKGIGVLKKTESVPIDKEMHSKSDYEIIAERNIFDSAEALPQEASEDEDKEKDVKYVPGQEAVKTALPVKVYAILVVGKGKDKRSSTTVGMGKKDIDVYSVQGEKSFSPGVTLVQVKPNRIEFVNKGRLEYAEMEEEGAKTIFGLPSELESTEVADNKEVKKLSGETVEQMEGKFVIDQREIDNALANLDKLYTEIRAVPNFKDGKVTGMKILSVKPASVFAKLGLKRGDILSRINGIELDVKRGFDIFDQLKDQKSFNLDLVRGGTTQTFEYEIR